MPLCSPRVARLTRRSRFRAGAPALGLATALLVTCFASAWLVVGCSSDAPSEAKPAPSPAVSPPDPASPSGEEGGAPPAEGGDAAPAAPGPPGSGGKGGLACSSRQEVSGRSLCVTKVGTLELKILEPLSGKGAMRLGVYLHGDGAAAHKSGSVFKPMAAWADAQRGLVVSVLAPNGCSWWQTPAHDCAAGGTHPDVSGANTPLLAGVMAALMKAYDLRTDGVRYYGASGGSIFLTEEWIPFQGASYPGIFALMCGGVDTRRPYAWDASNVLLRGQSSLWFTYGDRDHLFGTIQEAIADFKAKGFGVTEKIVPNAGHCEFDAHGEAAGIWSANP